MRRKSWWVVALIVALPALSQLGCGGEEDEGIDSDPEALARDLDLAFGRDDTRANNGDAALSAPGAGASDGESGMAPPSSAQSRTAPGGEVSTASPRVMTLLVPIGTTFAVHLDDPLSADRNHPGDPFSATLSDPVIDQSGRVLLPVGAKIRGRVTVTGEPSRSGGAAMIVLAFESISFDGRSFPLQASIVEVNPEQKPRTTNVRSAGGATSATTRSAAGQAQDGEATTLKTGDVVGTAAGTVVGLGTLTLDAVLPTGSRMVIRLDAPVEVQRVVG